MSLIQQLLQHVAVSNNVVSHTCVLQLRIITVKKIFSTSHVTL